MKLSRVTNTGAVFAAFGASLCCLGPVVLVALGLGTLSAAVSSFFEPLRPWLLAVAFGIIGGRLFALYRRPAPRLLPVGTPGHANGCEDPVDGTCCPIDPAHGKEKAVTRVALGFVVLFAAVPYLLGHASPRTRAIDAATAANGREVRFAIEGMTCGGCARAIEQAVAVVPGVVRAEVSFERKEALVIVDPAHDPGARALLDAVSAIGYQAREVSQGE